MKITDPEIIRTGERELIEAVKGDLDWGAIGEIVKQRINISSVDSTKGEILVHENQVAFRMDFLLKMELSLMFDRNGVLIPDMEAQNSELPSDAEDQMPPGVEIQESPKIDDPGFDLSDLDLADDDLTENELPGDQASETLDDDIDEILKESRDFWENKKNE